MNNQFLQHLKSITPQGKAEEKKIFIPASEFKDKKADPIEIEADEEQLDEATQSKYDKLYGRHVVGSGENKLRIARMKRAAAILRRGGADDETIKKGSDPFNIPMSHYNDVNMARYRFFNKAARSKEDGKKSPRSVKEAVSTGDPNRGRTGRAKPKLPPGLDPYDMYSKGEIRPYGGKLQKRIASMSAEDRKRYYREIGIRSRAASRAGKTQRLFPMTEGVKRMRRLRSARFGRQGVNKELDAAYDKELSKLSANRLRRGGAPKQTVRGFFTDKPTTKAADKAYSKFTKDAMNKAGAKGKKIFEEEKPTTTPTSTSKPKKAFKPKFGSYDKMMPSAFRHGVAAHQKKKALGAKPMTEAKKPLKKLKRVLKKVKRAAKGAYNILSTPQDNVDYMMTGRKF